MADHYLVNTNQTYREERFERRMLAEACVLAAYDSKEQIDCIEEGATVFLYSNNMGIIAFGVASGSVEVEDFEGHRREMHRMKLRHFRTVAPFHPAEIAAIQKQRTGKGVFFARAVQPLDDRTGSELVRLLRRTSKTREK